MGVVTVETGGDAAIAFEPAKATFDAVALFVEFLVVWKVYQPIGFGRDYSFYVPTDQQRAECIGIITTVSDDRLGGLVGQQGRSTLTIGLFPTGQEQA